MTERILKIKLTLLAYLLFVLKVLANEKKGGLKVVVFNKSTFKIFTLRFSNKSVQAPSCKRPKTTQRTLFLSLEINNWFPITLKCRRLIKKSGKLVCHVVNSTIAIGSLPALQTSHELLALLWRADLYRLLKYRGGCTIPLLQLSV
jgi:hypothetical protein